MALLAVERAVDDVAGVGQRRGELAIEIGIVLDDEEAQGSLLRGSYAGRNRYRFFVRQCGQAMAADRQVTPILR
jgi:hypothetical protein